MACCQLLVEVLESRVGDLLTDESVWEVVYTCFINRNEVGREAGGRKQPKSSKRTCLAQAELQPGSEERPISGVAGWLRRRGCWPCCLPARLPACGGGGLQVAHSKMLCHTAEQGLFRIMRVVFRKFAREMANGLHHKRQSSTTSLTHAGSK